MPKANLMFRTEDTPNFNTSLVTKAHSKLLANIEICNLDYSEVFRMVNKDDFLYKHIEKYCLILLFNLF